MTLTFLLGGPPYEYSTSVYFVCFIYFFYNIWIFIDRLVIGLFGLLGMLGVAVVPFLGRLIDKLVPWYATMIASFGLLFFQAIETGAGGINVSAVIITCFGIDVFRQMQQVSLTSAVFGLEARARARLNAILIISVNFFGCSFALRECGLTRVSIYTAFHWPSDGYFSRDGGVHEVWLASCSRALDGFVWVQHSHHAATWTACRTVYMDWLGRWMGDAKGETRGNRRWPPK